MLFNGEQKLDKMTLNFWPIIGHNSKIFSLLGSSKCVFTDGAPFQFDPIACNIGYFKFVLIRMDPFIQKFDQYNLF